MCSDSVIKSTLFEKCILHKLRSEISKSHMGMRISGKEKEILLLFSLSYMRQYCSASFDLMIHYVDIGLH